jgi:uncharacterized protein YdbL (DUF1318 family)
MASIFQKFLGNSRAAAMAAAFSLVAIIPICVATSQGAIAADLAADNATVDAAKANGVVGEQADGYLGYVNGSADSETTAAVSAINAARAGVYRQTASKSGVSPEAAGQATGALLIERVPQGQFYKPLGGAWTKK